MQFFIDTADVGEIKKALAMGLCDGVTTNPSLVAKTGRTYVSPFVGRLDDVSEDGMALIAQILEIFRNYDFATKVLVVSVRHPLHVLESARLGADVATIPFNVIEQLAKHPLTDLGLKKFLADWEKVPKETK